jgi:ABC-2 type transport system ATP-binding protein
MIRPPTADDLSVTVRGVSKRFGSTVALDNVDLTLGVGVTGLLGPNGAGKTTLLRVLATVLTPDKGDVRLLGGDPAHADARVAIRRRLGYMPQDPGYHQTFSAFDFVDYVAVLKHWGDRQQRHDEVRRVLEIVGLGDAMHKRIRSLSGGMRRRVGIAQSLLGAPDLLILDEPTAGLDPEQRLRFREVLSVHAESSIVLLSTHQTDDVAALCQRVVVLLAGAVCFDGTPKDLAALASGHVWTAKDRDPSASLAWVTPDGATRHVGEPPTRAKLVAPTVEDGYLLLTASVRAA